jgi:hypothetical protein
MEISPDHPGQEDDLADLHQRRGEGRAARTHRRDPPQRAGPRRQPGPAEDEEEVPEQIHDVGQHRGPHPRARRPHRLDVAPLRVEDEQRGDAGQPPPDELPGRLRDVGGDAERLEQVGEHQRRQEEHPARRHRDPQRLPVQPAGPHPVACAEGLADERIGPHQGSDAHDADGEHHRVAQRRSGELDRAGRPTTAVSTSPISACPAWARASGSASRTRMRSSSRERAGMGEVGLSTCGIRCRAITLRQP